MTYPVPDHAAPAVSRQARVGASPHLKHEIAFWQAGMRVVAGVDEVGRGALAGPLVAAAVVFPCCDGPALRRLRRALTGVRDSKQLTPERRRALLVPLAAANRLAMERAVSGLAIAVDALVLDALVVDLGLPQVGLIDGDARCLSIAAASIVAKVTRDQLMIDLDAHDPRYAFAAHKGYGSDLHQRRLREHGPGPHHRRCFGPVARLLDRAR